MFDALDPAELPADAVELGRILGPWGVQGWIKIAPHNPQVEALFSSKRWYLQLPASASHSTVLLPIRQAKQHGATVVAQSAAITDRDMAQALKGARVFVPRSSFPTPADDEYYWVDLIGLDVINRQGELLGQVKDLLSAGPQTTLVIQTANAAKDFMIPFVSAYVDEVLLAEKRIKVDWQVDDAL